MFPRRVFRDWSIVKKPISTVLLVTLSILIIAAAFMGMGSTRATAPPIRASQAAMEVFTVTPANLTGGLTNRIFAWPIGVRVRWPGPAKAAVVLEASDHSDFSNGRLAQFSD